MLKVFILVSGKTFFSCRDLLLWTMLIFPVRGSCLVVRPRISKKSCVHDSFLLVYENSFPSVIRFPFFKAACNLLPPPEMEGNSRLLEWIINSYLQVIKSSTQKLTLDLSTKPIIYNEYISKKLASSHSREPVAKDRDDVKRDAGADSEN